MKRNKLKMGKINKNHTVLSGNQSIMNKRYKKVLFMIRNENKGKYVEMCVCNCY